MARPGGAAELGAGPQVAGGRCGDPAAQDPVLRKGPGNWFWMTGLGATGIVPVMPGGNAENELPWVSEATPTGNKEGWGSRGKTLPMQKGKQGGAWASLIGGREEGVEPQGQSPTLKTRAAGSKGQLR